MGGDALVPTVRDPGDDPPFVPLDRCPSRHVERESPVGRGLGGGHLRLDPHPRTGACPDRPLLWRRSRDRAERNWRADQLVCARQGAAPGATGLGRCRRIGSRAPVRRNGLSVRPLHRALRRGGRIRRLLLDHRECLLGPDQLAPNPPSRWRSSLHLSPPENHPVQGRGHRQRCVLHHRRRRPRVCALDPADLPGTTRRLAADGRVDPRQAATPSDSDSADVLRPSGGFDRRPW